MSKNTKQPPHPEPETIETERTERTGQIGHHKEDWSNDIEKLDKYFANIELPAQPVRLNSFSTITDSPLFVRSHLATIKANNGNPTFLPHLNRLKKLCEVLTFKN